VYIVHNLKLAAGVTTSWLAISPARHTLQ